MVTVSFERFSSHLFLCYCLYHIAFFKYWRNCNTVVLQKPDNQLYADIVRSLKQNSRSEFQPPFVAPHGDRKVRIRMGCHYKSQLPEDHWQEKYNRNVKQSVQGFYTPAHVPYASVGDVCLNVKDHVVKTVGGEQSQEKVGCQNMRMDCMTSLFVMSYINISISYSFFFFRKELQIFFLLKNIFCNSE